MSQALFMLLFLTLATPKESLRFEFVHEQNYDASCGFAAVSTLLNLYWGINTSEQEIIRRFFALHNDLTIENVNEYNTTLADLAGIISDYGILNKSFRMSVEQLRKNVNQFAPLLAHYDKPDNHFALVFSVTEQSVITADPARGMEVISIQQFEDRWSGIALVTASVDKKINSQRLQEAIEYSLKRMKFIKRLAW